MSLVGFMHFGTIGAEISGLIVNFRRKEIYFEEDFLSYSLIFEILRCQSTVGRRSP